MDDLLDEKPDLSEVRKPDDYAIYYAGEEVAGHPLEEVMGKIFIYGRCDPPPTGEYGEGCPPPLQIHNYDACDWPPTFSQGPLYDFRGAKARGGGTPTKTRWKSSPVTRP